MVGAVTIDICKEAPVYWYSTCLGVSEEGKAVTIILFADSGFPEIVLIQKKEHILMSLNSKAICKCLIL